MTDKYPEHEKQGQILEQSRTIGEFLDWLSETKGLTLGKFIMEENGWDETFVPIYQPHEKLLADYFDIDLKKIEEEKRAMLERMREMDS